MHFSRPLYSQREWHQIVRCTSGKALIFATYTNFKLSFHLCTLPVAITSRRRSGNTHLVFGVVPTMAVILLQAGVQRHQIQGRKR